MKLTTIGLLSFSDEEVLFGDKSPEDTAERFHRCGVKEVVVKQGGKGYFLLSDSMKGRQVNVEVAPKVVGYNRSR